MNSKKIIVLLLLSLIGSCQKDGIRLKVDYSNSSSWQYLLNVDISGTTIHADSIRKFSSSLRTFLQGQPSDSKDKIKFTIKGTRIASDFLADAERTNLENQFEKLNLLFSPKDGVLCIPDTEDVPIIDIQGWDLYRNFAKVLPVFSESPVKEGSKWDRERQFPVQSNLGKGIGHLYQSFELDSVKLIDTDHHYAYISWSFNYQLEMRDKKQILQNNKFPLNGHGNGAAVLNLGKGVVESARTDFETDSTKNVKQQISWNESVHIELIK